MIHVPKEQISCIAPLFAQTENTMIRSCLEGCMGSVWTDRLEAPIAAKMMTAGFCFLAGDAHSPDAAALVSQIPDEYSRDFLIMVPLHPSWEPIIEAAFSGCCTRITRHSIRKSVSFDRNKLQELVSRLPIDYRLLPIDQKLYEKSKQERWSSYLCAWYPTWESFEAHGMGFAAIIGEELACGASSYSYYSSGIEVEIDTKEAHQRKGLAAACAARLILECLNSGLSVTWDAANWKSVRLAEKLGYRYSKPYRAYEIALSDQTE